jgi:hypothetical protein
MFSQWFVHIIVSWVVTNVSDKLSPSIRIFSFKNHAKSKTFDVIFHHVRIPMIFIEKILYISKYIHTFSSIFNNFCRVLSVFVKPRGWHHTFCPYSLLNHRYVRETYDLLGMNVRRAVDTQNIVTIKRHKDLAKHNIPFKACALAS